MLNTPWSAIFSTSIRSAGPPTQLLAAPLLIFLTAPIANADYRVTRSVYVLGMTAAETECGSNNTADQCAPGDSQSSATNVSGSVSVGSYSGMASASLATGEIKILATGPTYQSGVSAEWMDQLVFTGIAPGASTIITVDITLSGTYRDGSYITLDAGFLSGSYGVALAII
jgi:hypothetical protein